MRWSSQQLPVFIVAVSGFSAGTPKYFLTAVDEFLEEHFSGVEIRDIPTETVTVTAKHTQCIVRSLESGIDAFHRVVDSDLRCLSHSEKRNEHFEIARIGKIQQYGAKVKCVSWSVIWRSSRRPAYFAAMINDLLAQARHEYSNLNVPAYVSFHIYRSQHDIDRNIAVARVQWCDDSHRGFEAIKNVIDRENPRINYEQASPELHELIDAKSATPQCFVEHVTSLAPRLDDFALRLITAEQTLDGGKYFWTDDAIAEMERLDNAWEATPLAPLQFRTLNDVMSQYVFALTSHRIHAGKADWNLKGENTRYRMETTMEIQYYFGAWRVILKCDGWAV